MSGKRTVSEVIQYNGDIYILHKAGGDLVSPDYSGSGTAGDLIVSRDFDYGTVGLYYDETDGSFFSVVSLKQPKLGNMVYEFTSKDAAKKFFLELTSDHGGGLGSPKVNKEKAELAGVWTPAASSKIIDVTGQVNRVARRTVVSLYGPTNTTTRTPGTHTEQLYHLAPNVDLISYFDDAGKNIYKDSINKIETMLRQVFTDQVTKLRATIKTKMGEIGVANGSELIDTWLNDIVKDISQFGLSEKGTLVNSLPKIIGDVSKLFTNPDGTEESQPGDAKVPGEELLQAPDEEVPEIPAEPEAVEELTTAPEAPEPAAVAPEAPPPGTPAPAPNAGPAMPAPKASAGGTERTFATTPELRAVYAASKQKYQILASAKQRVMANTMERLAQAQKAQRQQGK